MAEIDLDMGAIPNRRAPRGIELDLKEVVESVACVVVRLRTTAIAPEVGYKGVRAAVENFHCALPKSLDQMLSAALVGQHQCGYFPRFATHSPKPLNRSRNFSAIATCAGSAACSGVGLATALKIDKIRIVGIVNSAIRTETTMCQ